MQFILSWLLLLEELHELRFWMNSNPHSPCLIPPNHTRFKSSTKTEMNPNAENRGRLERDWLLTRLIRMDFFRNFAFRGGCFPNPFPAGCFILRVFIAVIYGEMAGKWQAFCSSEALRLDGGLDRWRRSSIGEREENTFITRLRASARAAQHATLSRVDFVLAQKTSDTVGPMLPSLPTDPSFFLFYGTFM
jgi:hypothetical protein